MSQLNAPRRRPPAPALSGFASLLIDGSNQMVTGFAVLVLVLSAQLPDAVLQIDAVRQGSAPATAEPRPPLATIVMSAAGALTMDDKVIAESDLPKLLRPLLALEGDVYLVPPNDPASFSMIMGVWLVIKDALGRPPKIPVAMDGEQP
jgi:hypothetical protein